MKILITGATGFIGTNLCKTLLAQDHEILGIDNFYCSNRSHLQELSSFENFSFMEHDIINPIILPQSFVPDFICNFACPASPVQYLKDPIYTSKVSVCGILHVLDIAQEHNIPILHASTSEVYGDPLQHPQEEQHWGNVNPHGVRACYDEGKRMAESFCFDYNRMYGTKIKIIRIFNTYGPHMAPNDGRVISNFIMQAKKGIPLTVYGKGTQTRSFCYVDDLVAGIIAFLFLDDPEHKITGPINLGNPSEITINTLVTQIQEFIPNIEIINKPLPSDDPQQRKPNISLAKSTLQWEPRISLKEGLDKTIEWFQQYHSE